MNCRQKVGPRGLCTPDFAGVSGFLALLQSPDPGTVAIPVLPLGACTLAEGGDT